jgi:hypothetical protein
MVPEYHSATLNKKQKKKSAFILFLLPDMASNSNLILKYLCIQGLPVEFAIFQSPPTGKWLKNKNFFLNNNFNYCRLQSNHEYSTENVSRLLRF